jgi:hypothetical protein
MTKHCTTCGAKADSTANFCRLDGARLAVERPVEIGATVGYETLGLESPDLFEPLPSPANAEPTTPYPLRHLTEPTAPAAPIARSRAVAIGVALALLLALAPVVAFLAFASVAADRAAAQVSEAGAREAEAAPAPEAVVPAAPAEATPEPVVEEQAPAVGPILSPAPVRNPPVVRSTPRRAVRRASVSSRRSSPARKSSGSKTDDRREKKEKETSEDEESY